MLASVKRCPESLGSGRLGKVSIRHKAGQFQDKPCSPLQLEGSDKGLHPHVEKLWDWWRSCRAGREAAGLVWVSPENSVWASAISQWESRFSSFSQSAPGQALCSRLWGTDYDYDHRGCQHPGGPRSTLLALTCDQSGKEATAPSSEEVCLRSQGTGLLKNATLTLTPRNSVRQHGPASQNSTAS